eukprot:CAMPEP_0113498862 /NCGR_PEP_ID=MMETSP0014_2-20120614/31421_1 /TAXON_ID=2857 /ORGANISM="Nitzschia sp." /LENGTH=307 /DNA_ID=CAMNT_0000392959 /DNA_START=42 /DNA_END=965 /DNA_ORIENTATION=+ /assembly_acc=CAM_ASM_000159
MVVVVTVAVIVVAFVLALWCLAWSLVKERARGSGSGSGGHDGGSRKCCYYCCWCGHSCHGDGDNDIDDIDDDDDENPERSRIIQSPPPVQTTTSLTINDLIFNCSMDENENCDDEEEKTYEDGNFGNYDIRGSDGDGDCARNTSGIGSTNAGRRRRLFLGSGRRRDRRGRRPTSSRTSTTPTTMQQFFPDLLADTSIITDDGGGDDGGDDHHDRGDIGSRASINYGHVQQQCDDHHRHGDRNRRSGGRHDGGIHGSRFTTNIEQGDNNNNDNVSRVDDTGSPRSSGWNATTPHTRTRKEDLQEPLLG